MTWITHHDESAQSHFDREGRAELRLGSASVTDSMTIA